MSKPFAIEMDTYSGKRKTGRVYREFESADKLAEFYEQNVMKEKKKYDNDEFEGHTHKVRGSNRENRKNRNLPKDRG